MNNLISVCGNSGSGKSLVSCAIANEITRKYKKSVIIISPNKVAPMLPVFLPLQTFQRQNSIGDLFLNGVNFQNLKGKIHLHPKNSNLAFMGYIETDNIFRYNSDISKNEMFSLLSLLSNSSDNSLCDYVIIDCDHNIPSCNISSFAVDNSFANLIVASPDNKGISYLTSQEPFIYGSKNDNQKSITILN
ncbi:MAG: hypothetical protein RR048_01635, partial [Oscillospiraceae bacterium]